jgi:hypothetical protein
MRNKKLVLMAMLPLLTIGIACTSQRTASDVSYKDQVKKALEQADLTDVTVSEDKDKNTITLGGTVHSDSAKTDAGNVARSAAGSRVVANEISVQPVGAESQAKDMASNVDDGIENNYKAVLIANGLDKEHIRFDAKNGVLTLTGNVKTAPHRQEAEQLAQSVPNVSQVMNQLTVKR